MHHEADGIGTQHVGRDLLAVERRSGQCHVEEAGFAARRSDR
jgi:hypothetical protein